MDIENNINISGTSSVKQTNGDFLSQKPVNSRPNGTEIASSKLEANDASRQQAEGQAQIEEAVSRINEYVQNQQRTIRFSIDEKSGRDVVTVLDQKTDEVIRQIPREEILVVARRLSEQLDGEFNLFNSTA